MFFLTLFLCSSTVYQRLILPCSSISNFIISFTWSTSTYINSKLDLFISSSSHIYLRSSVYSSMNSIILFIFSSICGPGFSSSTEVTMNTTNIRPKNCFSLYVYCDSSHKTCTNFYQWVLFWLCTNLVSLPFLMHLHYLHLTKSQV